MFWMPDQVRHDDFRTSYEFISVHPETIASGRAIGRFAGANFTLSAIPSKADQKKPKTNNTLS